MSSTPVGLKTSSTSNHPKTPSSSIRNGSFTDLGKESPKIPTLTQVYELASKVGHAIEPISQEINPERLDHLTQNILSVLSLLENTAQTCQDLFKKEQQLLYDNHNLNKRIKQQFEHFEASELEYLNTVTSLSEQLEHFQKNIDDRSNEWEFNNSVSHVEENLAMALKEAQIKIDQLKQKEAERKEKEEQENKSKQSQEEQMQKDLSELNQLIEQKNYYKQRCFNLEDELRELKGEKHETLIESRHGRNNSAGNANSANNSSFVQNFTNFASKTYLNESGNGENNISRSMSTFFNRFYNNVGNVSSQNQSPGQSNQENQTQN